MTDIQGKYFGFVVDQVDEVTEIPETSITPPPHMGNDVAARYLTGVARIKDKLVLIMDVRKFLGEQEFANLAANAQEYE